MAAADSVPPYAAYNICTGHATTVRAAARLVAARLGAPEDLLQFGAQPYRTEDPRWLVGDPARLARATGWRPSISFEDGIDRIIEVSRLAAQPTL
ncbi:MAG: hypothetical protein HY246_03020 [Proteobacteria bacterium]|nr:hypothetical protein [Pseudomonadota bacterium]